MRKAKAIRMPGKERPATSRLGIQKPRRRSLTIGISQQRNPLADEPNGPAAEGLANRFLRSQPRVLGSGSLCKARPQQSDYHFTMHPDALNIGTSSGDKNRALPKHPVTR
jgi:hypothetical protein